MGFFERIGNGISIGFFSIFLPLRHPRLYMYSLLNLVIMGMVFSYIGFVALAQHLLLTSPSYFLSFLIYVVGFTLGSLVYVGLIRTVVGSYQGKSYGFFQAMEVSVTQLFYIFILTFLSTLINQLPGLAPSVASLGVVAFILAFFFGIINTFFLPVLAFERTGFFDIIGRSLRYFGRGIIEIISSMAVVSIVMGLFTGFAVFCIISFAGAEQVQLAARGSISWLSVFMPIMWLVVIVGVVFWMFITGVMTIMPTMYDYLTHDRKNPRG